MTDPFKKTIQALDECLAMIKQINDNLRQQKNDLENEVALKKAEEIINAQ